MHHGYLTVLRSDHVPRAYGVPIARSISQSIEKRHGHDVAVIDGRC